MEESKMELFSILLMNSSSKVFNLSASIGTTSNRLKEIIKEINSQHAKDIIIIKEEEVFLNETHVDTVYDLMISNDALVLDQSVKLLILKLSISVKENNRSLFELSELIEVSKNTALKYINQMKKELSSFNIELLYDRKKGYELHGSEELIRQYLIKGIYELLSIPVGKQILIDKNLIDKNECMFLYKRLENVEKRLNITFSDEMLESIPYTLFLLIKRVKNGSDEYKFSSEIREIIKSREYATISSVFWNYDFLKDGDLIYLTLLVLSSNLINSDNELYNMDKFKETLISFIDNLESKLAICFYNRPKLIESLTQHLRGTLFRLELGIEVFNPLGEQFINDYTSIYQIVKQDLKIFENITAKSIPDKEIAFISMIILGNLIENSEKTKEKPFKAVVVCKSGTSISRLLMNVLQDVFKFIDFERVYSIRQFNGSDHKDIDFIFSTIPVKTDNQVILVSSVLNNQEIKKVKNEVQHLIDTDSVKKAKYIISYLSEYLQHEKHNEALEEIQNALNFETPIESKTKDTVELLIDEDQISLANSNISWDELIDFAFEPLRKRDSINDNYIKRTKDVFYENYETMLIGPGVLLPHVTPKNDVKQSDVQILIFDQPLRGPNNEDYDIVVALAPGANNEHVKWIIKVNELLTETSLKEKILNSISKKEIMNIFREEGVLV